MKVFLVTYNWRGGYGAYEDKYYIIIANTSNEALGLALETDEDSKKENWTCEEISTEEAKAHYIAGVSN